MGLYVMERGEEIVEGGPRKTQTRIKRCRQRCMGRWPSKANSENVNYCTAVSPLPCVMTAKWERIP
ncbi:hypothetical protein BT96DRAFT_644691 [Gymnopus androsaceus JB14]|uniref:Uncharacterized protein n=1 Tax=Gymnopus androsaceus JB14 TaxID=1447944 RepID=A0A6A4GG73_9AGAR|nr:hypothetical protein BT96DRAFT_644691 [Gymnopus androsaceus JB14]